MNTLTITITDSDDFLEAVRLEGSVTSTGATLANTATASSTNSDPGSVTASATDTVLAPDLTITKTGSGTVNSRRTACSFDDHGEQHGRGCSI